MTPAQSKALIAICNTNGGGVEVAVGTSDQDYGIPTQPVYRALWDKDLIQGKANHAYRVVHTRKGWELFKELTR